MKRLRFIWQKVLAPAGVIYTLLTIVLLLLLTLTGNTKPAINLASAVIFLLLSLLIGCCNLIFELKTLSLMTRTVLHFFAVLLSVIVTSAAGSYEMNVQSLTLILVYTVLYLIIVPPFLIVGIRVSKKQKEDKTYTSMFDSKK